MKNGTISSSKKGIADYSDVSKCNKATYLTLRDLTKLLWIGY